MNTERPHTSTQVLYFMEKDKKMSINIMIPYKMKESMGFVVYPVSLLAASVF